MQHGESFEKAIDDLRHQFHHLMKEVTEYLHCEDGTDEDEIVIIKLLRTIRKNQELQMAQIDDLNAALTDVANKLVTLDTDVKAIPTQTQTPPTDLTQVLSSVQSISNQVDAIDAEVKALQTPPSA